MILDDEIFRHSLERAARRAKVQINTSEMITVLRADSTFIIAPLCDFDVSPATELPNGVDSAFAYIDSPDRQVPPGYYTLRVRTDAAEVGELPGTVEYVDRRGQVVSQVGVQVEVESLTLLDPPPFPHAVINLESRVATQGELSLVRRADVVIVCCPNGYCWFEKR